MAIIYAPVSSTDFRTDQYYILGSSVMFYYDFVLTLPQEIKYIWFSKFGLVNVLLIALRYVTAIGYVPIIWLTFSPVFDEKIALCAKLDKLPGIIGIICQSLTLVFLIIRLFAIYDNRKWVLYTTAPCGLMNIALSILALVDTEVFSSADELFITGNAQQVVSSSCLVGPIFNGLSQAPILRYELSYIAIITFDTWICILSVSRMGRMFRAKRLFHSGSSIVNIFLRDGVILYAILTISNAFNFVAFMLAIRSSIDSETLVPNFADFIFVTSSGTNSELTHALSAIFVSRMVFNLREAGTEVYEGTEEWRSRIERATKDMQFRIPTTVQASNTDIMEGLDGCKGAEVSVPAQENASA